ncbi:Ribosome biogenesis nsa-2 [Gossypium arboreum]|uniref:Ribosome biogenesis nsa-2 n=1 Tax=Gossypium arboreum TaxID=29729 RepID=A0A0B0MVM9_GOSAR|nr:Ribosome biogenesis nsa-2 [Gossypium arboreum]
MDVKRMFPWMRWMFQLHNSNHGSQTKMVSYLQRRKKNVYDGSEQVSTSINDAAMLLGENIRTVGLELSKSIASEKVIKESAKKLYLTLYKVEGLTEDECYRVLSKIPYHPMQMLIFFSLPSSVRLEWVGRFLSNH